MRHGLPDSMSDNCTGMAPWMSDTLCPPEAEETQELDMTGCSAAGTELPCLSCMGCGP